MPETRCCSASNACAVLLVASRAGSTISASSRAICCPIAVTMSRSEEHTSELQSLMRNSYAVFCLKKKKNKTRRKHIQQQLHTEQAARSNTSTTPLTNKKYTYK